MSKSTNKTRVNLSDFKNKKGAECIKVLNEIDFLISNASTVPLTSKVMVDAEYLFSLAEKFRLSFPEELEQADMVINEIQEIAEEAENEAEKIINDAHMRAQSILNESRILKEAQGRASMLINEAMMVREQMQREAEEYVYSLFAEAEHKLMDNTNSVREAIASIKQPIAKKQI